MCDRHPNPLPPDAASSFGRLRRVVSAGIILALALHVHVEQAAAGPFAYDLGDFTPNSVSHSGGVTYFWGNGPSTAEFVTLDAALNLTRTSYYGPGGISFTATGMSSNAGWAAGYGLTPGSVGLGEGLVVNLVTGEVHQVGHIGIVNQSAPLNVSNNGIAVGHADGARQAFTFSLGNGIQPLPAPPTSEFAMSVSDQGNVVGGVGTNHLGTATAAIWRDGAFSFLEDHYLLQGRTDTISPDGLTAAGSIGRFNIDTFATEQLLASWDAAGLLSLFTDALGNDAFGIWNSVTNNGFYGGRSSDGLAIVFDPTDGFVDTPSTTGRRGTSA